MGYLYVYKFLTGELRAETYFEGIAEKNLEKNKANEFQRKL